MCKERFGHALSDWFTLEAVEEATKQVFNQVTNTMEDNRTQMNKEVELLESFGHHTTEAAGVHVLANEEVLTLYDTGFDSNTSSDDESDSKTTTIFDLKMLFQLKSSTEGALGMNDHTSTGIYATNLTKATTDIHQETKSGAYTEIIVMASALTEATLYMLPQHSQDSRVTSKKTSFCSRSHYYHSLIQWMW